MPLVLASDPLSLQSRVLTAMARLRQGVTVVRRMRRFRSCVPRLMPPNFKRYKESPLYLKSLRIKSLKRISQRYMAFSGRSDSYSP